MDEVRQITSQALALRKARRLRVRLPLAGLTAVTAHPEALEPFAEILREELNVKSVTILRQTEQSAAEHGIVHTLAVNARAAGPRIGKDVQQAIKGAKSGDWSETDGVVTAGGIVLEPHEYELTLKVGDGSDGGPAITLIPGGGFVLLDTTTTPELEAEGLARDAVRAVQEARKNAGLDVTDRIALVLTAAPEHAAALQSHGDLIAAETLATGGLIVQTVQDGNWDSTGAAPALGAEKAPLGIALSKEETA